jgi:predicted secreted protein
MSIALGVAIYFIVWWTVLFAVLPIGLRTQEEDGHVVPGTPASAPTRPRFLLIFALTSLISGAVFALIYAVVVWQIIDWNSIFPFGPGR